MSHGDQVRKLPPGFEVLARTENCSAAAVKGLQGLFYGVQFHPEVVHTPRGKDILANFLFRIAGLSATWSMPDYLKQAVERIRQQVKDGRVICGLSGGIDSAVTAVLTQKAVGDRLWCIFVDTGLLRLGEAEEVEELFGRRLKMNLRMVKAADIFFSRLRGVTDPEEKRRIIGRTFIDVFQQEAAKLGEIQFLAQGTLYPDVIESTSAWGGPSARIKTHHNVGGLPARLGFKLVEPLRLLFKDEVRQVARHLGLPETIVHRQPFPGPGLAVRILGEVTPARVRTLQQADAIAREEIERVQAHAGLWQYFIVLLDARSVGVMGDGRTYENVAALRVVESQDGMTADWALLPRELLHRISSRIINEVRGINRVVLDITSKPPGTIEWE
jgi:GMP synthase (glutamine-hydrolysing)